MKIGIAGCRGRVGNLLIQELLSGNIEGVELAGGIDLESDPTSPYLITNNPDEIFKIADAVIDFSSPDATRKHAWMAAKHKKVLVVGTTGLTTEHEDDLREAAQETAIVYAANMSFGVNILLALIEQAAAKLQDDWDIEIFEAHHKHKVDAPSGTALAMGKAAAKGRDVDLDKVADYTRHGYTGARTDGNIGFSVARGGDVVGKHTAYFFGQGEQIELTHVATNRSLYAKGAIKAAQWATKQKPGLYSMCDILNI